MMTLGCLPSTLQPTDTAVPRISLHVPPRLAAQLRGRITLAISITSLSVMLPVCLMFFSCSHARMIRGQHAQLPACGTLRCECVRDHGAGC